MSERKETLDERFIRIAIDVFFIGLFVVIMDLLGVTLDWQLGVGMMVATVGITLLAILVGSVVFAIREMKRRKAE